MKLDTRKPISAVYLMDEKFCTTRQNGVPSGWDYDFRGSATAKEHELNPAHYFTTSADGKYPMTLARTFTVLHKGKASFAYTVQLKSGDGHFVELYSTDNKTAFSIEQKNGMFWINGGMIACPAVNKTHTIGIEFNLDEKNADISVNGVFLGTYSLLGKDLYKIKLGYRAGSVGSCNMVYVGLWVNYLVCDKNLIRADGPMPYGWKNMCGAGSSAGISYYYEGSNLFTYQLCAAKKSTARVAKDFEKTSGRVCFDIKYLTRNENGENVRFSLTAGGKECVSVCDNGSKSYSKGVSVLREHHSFVWQRIRIEADTNTQKAFVWHNGKKCTYIDFDEKTPFFDGLSVSYAPENGGIMKFTDVVVYKVLPEPEDYPKEPVMPTRKSNVYTGMNVCSLWREGGHYGWENIVNYDDNMPILGPYDEGITEVADWEIKYMAEHGLDSGFYCWYGTQQGAPFVKTHLSDALEDGHFYAKYGDKVKFALIWEASNSSSLTSLEEFKKYFVPYWIDHFFSDDRYFRIDGVAMLAIFGLGRLIKDLGGAEKVKECIEYLRSELIKIGYKGLAVISNTPPGDDSVNCGMSASYAYHWGFLGYNPNHQKACIKNQMAINKLHVVPTLSVGYNDLAWRVAERVPNISLPDMKILLDWMIDDVLASYKDMPEEWQRKLLMFSTWNEFGEGTFMSPAGLNGFGYLNEMRKAVTEEGDCLESERPSENAYNRLGYMFPRGRKLLRTPQLVPIEKPSDVVAHFEFSDEESLSKFASDYKTVNTTTYFSDGKLCGNSVCYDPQLWFDVDLDADDIDAITIKMRAADETQDTALLAENPTGWRIYFATENEPELSQEKSFAPTLMLDTVHVSGNSLWKGRLKTLRIDPITSKGVYEIESITFLKRVKKDIETYVDGQAYNSHYPSKVQDGEVYVSFEPFRDFHRFLNIYYEWDDDTRTLRTEFDGKVYYWTENSDVVKHDGGDIRLKKPLEFYDGLPYMPMSVISEITGCTYKLDGLRLDITTA